MKVLLINPPIRMDDTPRNFPTGIGLIAAVTRNAGYNVVVLDINGHRYSNAEVSRRLAETDADVIGIGGLVTVYGYLKNFLIPEIKINMPGAKVVVGGGIGSSIPNLLLDIGADVIVRGEGEKSFVELLALREKEEIESVDGISYRCEGAVIHNKDRAPIRDLDRLPLPAYDLFDMEETYFKSTIVAKRGIRDIQIIASRGCPFACSYCFDLFRHRYRIRSVGHVFGEINYLIGTYGVEHFSFQDDTLTIKKGWVRDFCDFYESCGYDFRWSCTSRTDSLDAETFKRMRECGCTSVSFGIESGSQRVLDLMSKQVNVETAENAVRWARAAGLLTPVSFIHGWPGETIEDMNATRNFCIRNGIPLQSLMYATPFPGTELYEDMKPRIVEKFGSEGNYLERVGNCVDFTINLTELSDEELQYQRERMIQEVLAAVPRPTPEAVEAKERELYGDRLHQKIKAAMGGEGDEQYQRHREQHGFNE